LKIVGGSEASLFSHNNSSIYVIQTDGNVLIVLMLTRHAPLQSRPRNFTAAGSGVGCSKSWTKPCCARHSL